MNTWYLRAGEKLTSINKKTPEQILVMVYQIHNSICVSSGLIKVEKITLLKIE